MAAQRLAQEAMQTNESGDRLNALAKLRRLLSQAKDPPIQEAIDSGIVPLLVKWALTKVDSSQFCAISPLAVIFVF
eukprot:m.281490 g.281490  ORF g.281490 m.281490 type:complete len:76 (+) comp22891_c3_seq3:34-261(+)